MGSIRLKAVMAGFTITLGLTGCSSLHLYNSARDQQGVAAKKAWSEVDLPAITNAERANLKNLLVVELETQEQLANAIRERELRRMVQSTSLKEGLVAPIDEKLKSLMTGTELPSGAWNTLHASQIVTSAANDIFKANSLPAPSCASIADGATPKDIQSWLDAQSLPIRKASIMESLDTMRTECEKRLSGEDVYKSMGAAIQTAWQEYHVGALDLAARKKEVKGLRETYEVALKDYDKALKDATPDLQSAANVNHAAVRIRAAIDALKDSSSPYAAKLLAEENLKSLGAFAQAITEAKPGAPLPKGASKTAVAFIVLPEFFDEANSALAQATTPLALPLIIRRNFEHLNLEAAKRDIASQEAIVVLSHDLVETLYQQAEQLIFARAALAQQNVALLHKETFAGALTKGGSPEREALYRAAALYLDAVNRLDARRYKLEYMRIAAYHERSLSYAEVNAKQWESLIGTTVDQVADYSASGLKPEQIANALNTLGIFYIGAGVNK